MKWGDRSHKSIGTSFDAANVMIINLCVLVRACSRWYSICSDSLWISIQVNPHCLLWNAQNSFIYRRYVRIFTPLELALPSVTKFISTFHTRRNDIKHWALVAKSPAPFNLSILPFLTFPVQPYFKKVGWRSCICFWRHTVEYPIPKPAVINESSWFLPITSNEYQGSFLK